MREAPGRTVRTTRLTVQLGAGPSIETTMCRLFVVCSWMTSAPDLRG
jgi:hypothetical protein